MSQTCGTVGLSWFQVTVTWGDRRARAQELLSPFDGTLSWLGEPMPLNEISSLCNTTGGVTSLPVVFAEEIRILLLVGFPLGASLTTAYAVRYG